MKTLLLPLALVAVACQAPQRAQAVHQSVPAPAPQAAAEPADDAAAPALPRWNHLDRAEYAVRQWVRDRS